MEQRKKPPDVPSGYTIHRAEPEHLPFLNGIELAAASIFPTGFLSDAVRSESVPMPVLEEAMNNAHLWVALEKKNQCPVGYALLQIHNGFALLAQMDVHPKHGRKGLGTALVHRVIDAALSENFAELYLTTFSHIPWNAPFYSKLGFERLEPEEEPFFIQVILKEERARGLTNRVAMRLTLTSVTADQRFFLSHIPENPTNSALSNTRSGVGNTGIGGAGSNER
jgi:N-acetylglutamate synthase and related acetyltransferases